MRRLAACVAVVGASLALLGLAPLAAGASVQGAKVNPCKLLKGKEIAQVLGQEVGKPKKDLTTAVSRQCKWEVRPTAVLPDGVVAVLTQTVGAKVAYDVNSKARGVEAVPELGKAYYDPKTGAITVLKGKVLLNVQGVFVSIEGGTHTVDRKDELIELMKIARKRL
jgi:hypothetical protein